jgi:hypothetical protein
MVPGDGVAIVDVLVPVLDFLSGVGTPVLVLDEAGEPEVDGFGEPTGYFVVEELVSTFVFELFVDPATN